MRYQHPCYNVKNRITEEYEMIFHPQNIIKTEGSFTFWGNIPATVHPCLDKDIIKEFWSNFTYQSSPLSISRSNEFIFLIGNKKPIPLGDSEYSINIEEEGICVYAANKKSLLCGFMTLLDRFKATAALLRRAMPTNGDYKKAGWSKFQVGCKW